MVQAFAGSVSRSTTNFWLYIYIFIYLSPATPFSVLHLPWPWTPSWAEASAALSPSQVILGGAGEEPAPGSPSGAFVLTAPVWAQQDRGLCPRAGLQAWWVGRCDKALMTATCAGTIFALRYLDWVHISSGSHSFICSQIKWHIILVYLLYMDGWKIVTVNSSSQSKTFIFTYLESLPSHFIFLFYTGKEAALKRIQYPENVFPFF